MDRWINVVFLFGIQNTVLNSYEEFITLSRSTYILSCTNVASTVLFRSVILQPSSSSVEAKLVHDKMYIDLDNVDG